MGNYFKVRLTLREAIRLLRFIDDTGHSPPLLRARGLTAFCDMTHYHGRGVDMRLTVIYISLTSAGA